jgi:hypothetical protein
MVNNPYTQSGGPPQMLPSFVCYADILGYSKLSKDALESGNGEQFLRRLHHALSQGYARVREHSERLIGGDTPFFYIKIFTDNIVVGYPLYSSPDGEFELGHILGTFAEFQFGLAMEGFFLRGGIAYGNHYMDENIVFGDAFLQAVGLDKGGGPPRLTLAPSAIQMVRRHLGYFGEPEWSPTYEGLYEDADGTIFLNYLSEAFMAYPDGGVFLDWVEAHQRSVTQKLQEYRGSPGIRSKYEWAARYHNFFCRDFAECHPVNPDPEADPEATWPAYQAQQLLDYLIDVESLAAAPCRINLTPIRLVACPNGPAKQE